MAGGAGAPAPERAFDPGEPPGAEPSKARLPLADRLAREARERPAQSPRAEALVRALEQRGVAFARTRQVLASPLGAAYCAAAVSAEGLALSVCEFADEAAAEAGRERSRALFDALVPGRTLIAQGGALLTLTRPESAAAADELELASALFAALEPAARPR